ncbi:enoyl-CoA hydratase-related protein [Paracoccus aminophilus]|uniref:Carnitinyl-CoA dehydratase n=1 Tax=Paracoccus aminophilus JCM 7686 TaxID=1367847 RepID=S5XQV3_PARAH|nr:enoyl-CoA hydratase-related protein [Paracoccus aminophilus]AGT09784.1 carnitinyl-CoA dehydratase [Paracoccus aminophilus JCM 7686]
MIDALNAECAGYVELHAHGAVLEIRMVKGPVNAICRPLSRAVGRAASFLQDSPDFRVGLLTSGCARAFSAGLDFTEHARVQAGEELGDFGPGGFGGISTLFSLKKPLIAVIEAPAVGGGFEIVLACDLILMAEESWLQLPEMQRGIMADGGGIQRLPRRLPYNLAVAKLLTGDPITPDEALRHGLAYAVTPRAELAKAAQDLAQRLARDAPLAQQALKEVLRAIEHMPIEESMMIHGRSDPGFETYAAMWASEDAREGPRAFLEKRPPRWRGA